MIKEIYFSSSLYISDYREMDREVFLLGFTDTGWWLSWSLDFSVTAQGMKNHSKADVSSKHQSGILNHFIKGYFNNQNRDCSRRIMVSVCKTWMCSKSKNKKNTPIKSSGTATCYHIITGNKDCEWRKNWALIEKILITSYCREDQICRIC